ncbi:MAG: hypothetical protein AAF355_11275 [Myxococcota bacterium]
MSRPLPPSAATPGPPGGRLPPSAAVKLFETPSNGHGSNPPGSPPTAGPPGHTLAAALVPRYSPDFKPKGPIQSTPSNPIQHPGPVASVVAWNPTKPLIAIRYNDEPTGSHYVEVRNLDTNTLSIRLRHACTVPVMEWSPDGNLLATGSEYEHQVTIWRAHTGVTIGILTHSSSVTTMAWSPNGKILAVGCKNKDVCIWKTESWTRQTMPRLSSSIISMAWRPDGKVLAAVLENGAVNCEKVG